MAKQQVIVSVLADTRKFSNAMRKLGQETGLSKIGAGFKKVAKASAVALGAAGAAAGAFALKSVSAAGDLEQSIGAIDTVFKKNSKQVHKWAKNAAEDVGLNRNSYNELATVIGTQLKNGGTAMDEIAGKTNDLIGLGADLSSMFGGTTADAVGALSSALKGEMDPIERYGVSLNDTALKAKAAAMGMTLVSGKFTTQQKQAATLALIMDQTADAQGNFARESDTLQHKQQVLKAKFDNIVQTVGTYLLPAMTAVTGWVSDRLQPAFEAVSNWVQTTGIPLFQAFSAWLKDNVVPVVQDLATRAAAVLVPALQAAGQWITGTLVPGLADLGAWIVRNKDWLLPLAVAITTMVAAWQAAIRVIKIAQAVQAVFNVVLAANPIGIVVMAIAGLVAGLTFFFTKTKTGQMIWNKAWGGIKTAFNATWGAIKTGLNALWGFIKKVWSWTPIGMITSNWNKIKTAISTALGAIGGFFTGVWNTIKKVWSWTPIGLITSNWDAIIGWFAKIPERIGAVFSGAVNWLKDAGSNIVSGLLKGIGNGAASIGKFFLDKIPGWIKTPFKKVLGIKSPSRVFAGYGRNIVQGLAKGITDNKDLSVKAITDLSTLITKTQEKAISDEAKRLVAARRKANAKITKQNKTLAKKRDADLAQADKISDAKQRAAARRRINNEYKAKKKDTKPALSLADATKQAKKDLAAQTAAAREANKLLAAQTKTTSKLWAKGTAAGVKTFLGALTKNGAWTKKAGAEVRGATLADIAKAREYLAGTIKSAKDTLANLKAARESLKNSVADSVKSELDLTAAIAKGSDGNILKGQTTFAAVKTVVTGVLAKAKEFTGKMRALIQAGFPAALVQQIAGYGMDNAIEIASALLSGTKVEQQSLIKDYGAIGTWAASAGDAIAGQMYDAGIAAQQGLIKGLESDDAKLKAAAKNLASKLTKAVKKALGIKSPSRVFRSLGAFTIAGLRDGLAKTAPITRVMDKITSAVETGYNPTLTAPTITPPTATAAATGPGVTYNITVHAGLSSPLDTAREIKRLLTRLERFA